MLKRWALGAFWVGLYLTVSLAPLFIAILGPHQARRDFWIEFSVALGFVGLAMLCLQFALTARFKNIAAPYGIDMILQFHRQISLVAFGMILAHPLILVIVNQEMLSLLNPVSAPWRARMGQLSVAALVLLLVLSLGRKQLGIRYERWRLWHGILAVIAVAGALAHVLGVGYYLSLPWKRTLWDLIAASTIGLLVYIRIGKPLQMLRRPYVVESVRPERGNTWTLTLRPEGHEGIRFQPGQFAWLRLGRSPFGVEDHPISYASSAEQTDRVELSIKALGDFTSTIQRVEPGTRAYLDGPYGAFTIDRHQEESGFVFVAGGVGITPLISMLRTMADRQDGRPVLLVYASKNWEAVTFREDLERLSDRLDLKVVHVLDQAPESWTGERGFITPELLARHLPEDRRSREYFLCGPPPMMQAVERSLLDIGVQLADIHMERFNLV